MTGSIRLPSIGTAIAYAGLVSAMAFILTVVVFAGTPLPPLP
jgi:hypothetical protein